MAELEKIGNTIRSKGLFKGKNNPCFGLFGKDHPAYGTSHSKESIKKRALTYSTNAKKYGYNSGPKNSRYGDHRNFVKLHGKIKAKKLKELYSKTRKGKLNSNSKKWKLVNPMGKEFIVEGELKKFCKENNLAINALRNRIGKPYMPKIVHKRHESITNNTKGWILYGLCD